jgi:Lon protease-like protein
MPNARADARPRYTAGSSARGTLRGPTFYLSRVPLSILPLFPLPLVLFPGAPLPLHIFEPRYRQLLADCVDGDSRFGIVFRAEGVSEADIEPGTVGCIAEIDDAHTLPDGRSNIVVHGVRRFSFLRFVVTPAPYRVAQIAEFEDLPEEEAALAPVATRVRALFDRVGRAARTLADDRDPLPPLPDNPDALSFGIASLIDIEAARRQKLLESRLASERLETLSAMLSEAVEPLEARARIHRNAKGNGRGPYAAK